MIDCLADAVVLVDAAGTVHYISAAVRSILGFSPAEVVGRSIWGLVHEDDVDFLKGRLASRIRGEGDPKTYTEIRMRHRDGHLRFLQLRGRLYQSRSGTPMVLVTARDITELLSLDRVDQSSDSDALMAAEAPAPFGSASSVDGRGSRGDRA